MLCISRFVSSAIEAGFAGVRKTGVRLNLSVPAFSELRHQGLGHARTTRFRNIGAHSRIPFLGRWGDLRGTQPRDVQIAFCPPVCG